MAGPDETHIRYNQESDDLSIRGGDGDFDVIKRDERDDDEDGEGNSNRSEED